MDYMMVVQRLCDESKQKIGNKELVSLENKIDSSFGFSKSVTSKLGDKYNKDQSLRKNVKYHCREQTNISQPELDEFQTRAKYDGSSYYTNDESIDSWNDVQNKISQLRKGQKHQTEVRTLNSIKEDDENTVIIIVSFFIKFLKPDFSRQKERSKTFSFQDNVESHNRSHELTNSRALNPINTNSNYSNNDKFKRTPSFNLSSSPTIFPSCFQQSNTQINSGISLWDPIEFLTYYRFF